MEESGFTSKGWNSGVYFISTQPLQLRNKGKAKNVPLKSSAYRPWEAPGKWMLPTMEKMGGKLLQVRGLGSTVLPGSGKATVEH